MPIANFHDVALDFYQDIGAKVTIRYQTFVHRMREGHEERVGEWQDPLWLFDITPALRDQDDLDELLTFFRARDGQQNIFKFLNILDYTVTNETFFISNGVQTVVQLCRKYSSQIVGDDYYYVRPITIPDAGIQFYDNGVLITSGVSYTLDGGVVTFTTAPLVGHIISWTGTYHTPIRFAKPGISSIIEVYERFEDQVLLIEERIQPQATVFLTEVAPPDFVETRFPANYATRASMGPELDSIIITSDSGATGRTRQFAEPKLRFSIEGHARPLAELHSMMAFFINRKGRLVGFRAKDITDFECVNQLIGIGDGVVTEFQLVKNYISGPQTGTRTITKPNTDFTIYLDDVPLDPQPDIDYTSGIVTFITAPELDVEVSATGTFDVPVRFDKDEITFSLNGYEYFNMESIGLAEIAIDLPDIDISAAAAQPVAILSGCSVSPFPFRPAVTKYIDFTGVGSNNRFLPEPNTTGGIGQYFYNLLRGAASVTVAFLVSHVGLGEGGIINTIFDHEYPGQIPGFRASIGPQGQFLEGQSGLGGGNFNSASPGFENLVSCPANNFGLEVYTGHFTPTVFSSSDSMHAYCLTMDWANMVKAFYGSGSCYGITNLTSVGSFTWYECIDHFPQPIQIIPHGPVTSYAAVPGGSGAGYNDCTLGAVSIFPNGALVSGRFTGRLYELIMIINPSTLIPVSPKYIAEFVHRPILEYWAYLYGVGYRVRRRLAINSSNVYWWRADENITVVGAGDTGPVQLWEPVGGGFNWCPAGGAASGDVNQPHVEDIIGAFPLITDELRLANGKKLRA